MKKASRIILLAVLFFTLVCPATGCAPPATPPHSIQHRDPASNQPPSLPRTQTITIPTKRNVQDVSFELVRLPAGRITLKDEHGRDVEHSIKSIWMAKYETRWDEYNVFWQGLDLTEQEYSSIRSDDSRRRTRPEQPYMRPSGATPETAIDGSGYPADCITLTAAKKYCAWLSSLTGKKFRLPTEAEWEYACRAGGPPLKPDAKALGEVAWYLRNSADLPYGYTPGTRFDEDYGRVRPVGQKRPNAWGLYDMLGNVGEYVVRDPNDDKGLLAGGSYQDDAKDVHSGAREPFSKAWLKYEPQYPPSPDWLFWSLHRAGFRVVMEE